MFNEVVVEVSVVVSVVLDTDSVVAVNPMVSVDSKNITQFSLSNFTILKPLKWQYMNMGLT